MLIIEHRLGKMVDRLDEMNSKHKRAMKRGISSAGRAARSTAAKSVIDRGEFRKAPGAAGRIRKGMVFKPDHVNLGGTLTSRAKSEGLIHWAKPRGLKMSYVGKGTTVNQGDIIQNRRLFTPYQAFARGLGGGKGQLLWRDGHRSIGGVYRAVPGSRLLIDSTTGPETISRYFDVYSATYERNMGF